MELNYQQYLQELLDWAVHFAPKLLMSIVVVILGFWLIKRIGILFKRTLEKANINTGVSQFLYSLSDLLLKFVVFLIAGRIVGIEVSSLLGILAAAGFAVGLALQGFLGNFAAGITIVFFKPYRIEDWVEISDKFGKVSNIHIFNTTIITPGNKTLIIPNGQVTDHIITNFSTQGHIKLELEIPIPYKESFPEIKTIIQQALDQSKLILQEPEAEIGIGSFDSHSILLHVRPYIKPDDFWEATFEVHQCIKQAFHAHEIPVAYSEGIELGAIGN